VCCSVAATCKTEFLLQNAGMTFHRNCPPISRAPKASAALKAISALAGGGAYLSVPHFFCIVRHPCQDTD